MDDVVSRGRGRDRRRWPRRLAAVLIAAAVAGGVLAHRPRGPVPVPAAAGRRGHRRPVPMAILGAGAARLLCDSVQDHLASLAPRPRAEAPGCGTVPAR